MRIQACGYGVGGIIVMAIGLGILKLKETRTIDMLPSLVLIVLYGLWVGKGNF